EHPPNAKRGSKRFAGGANKNNAFGGETLQRANRFAIIPIFSVVIVFEHERATELGPGEQGRPARGREHGPGWIVVRRCHVRGSDLEIPETFHTEAATVHRYGDQLES